MLHPEDTQKVPYITSLLGDSNDGPTIATTDYIKSYADQVRAYVPGNYKVLGTDGFGRSDSRANLRRHFEVNPQYIVVATLHELAKAGEIKMTVVSDAIAKFGIDADKINPLYA
jgi:pyruvate dehydrogenase E1 component